MPEKRVYPSKSRRWTAYALLIVSLALVVTGLFGRGAPMDDVALIPQVAPTPDLSAEEYDQTPTERELTLPERTYYTIQLAAYENEQSAMDSAAAFQKRGAAGYVMHDMRYRVLAALYLDRMDAQLVRVQLNETNGLDAYVYPVTLPSITLRMTGSVGQLDALEAACDGALTLLDELQALSVHLDRQTLTAEETVLALREHGETARLLATRLEQRFTPPRHKAVECLQQGLAAFGAAAAAASAKDGSVLLATQTKYQAFALLDTWKTLTELLTP